MNITVIGAGTMGHGIAYVAAVAGHDVVMSDISAAALERALEQVRASADSAVARGKLDDVAARAAVARVSVSDSLETSVMSAEVVIEAVPEALELKQDIFRRIAASAQSHALLATNTSSLSVTDIASVIDAPERVIGMHFFNPVAAMKLVEIVRGAFSSDESVARARDLVTSIARQSIVVGDTPGFATSRLGVVLGLEAMRMLEQGVATAEDIDAAMVLGYNHPVGPLKLTDIVGLDVRLAVADRLHGALGGDTYSAPSILREMVAKGDLGRKTGQGFYDWR